MRKYLISLFISILSVIIFTSCENERFNISTENIEINNQYYRFDEDIFNGDYNNPLELKQHLYQKYGNFYPSYVERIISIGPGDSLSTILELNKFVTNDFIIDLQNDIDSLIKDDKKEFLDAQFEDAFKRAKFYLPELNIPDIIYFNSGFNNGVVVLENQIAIGLDFYLGANNQFISRLPGDQFQQFKREKMDEIYLVSDVLKYWLEIELDKYWIRDDLLSDLVYKGKIMFLMDAIFPEMEDHIKMRYFEDELVWSFEHEQNIWTELAKEDVIYNTRSFDNRKWLIDGPFTNVGAIPAESPPRLGEWVGWQMARDYMNENKEISIGDFISNDNKQEILRSYNPK